MPGCAINQNSVSISAYNDYENTVIEIKRLLRPIPPPFAQKPNFTCKSVKSCNETFAKWDVLDLFKLIRFIHVFKCAEENLR